MAKGGSFELEMAKELSLLWSEGQRDDLVRRTSGSGGRFTVRKKAGKDTAFDGGDLTLADPEIQPLFDIFHFEVKTGYCKKSKSKKDDCSIRIQNWCVLDIIDGKKSKNDEVFQEMINQAYRDAEQWNPPKIPILLFRRLGHKACVCFPARAFYYFGSWFGIFKATYLTLSKDDLESEKLWIMSWSDFKDWCVNLKHACGLFTSKKSLRR